MSNNFVEKRSEPRSVIDKYYSVDFSIGNDSLLYQFRLWNLSSKGLCIIVKENSAILNHINIGDVVKMKYYKIVAIEPAEYIRTEIRHISQEEVGQFKGHFVVGIQILEDSN